MDSAESGVDIALVAGDGTELGGVQRCALAKSAAGESSSDVPEFSSSKSSETLLFFDLV